MRMLKDCLNPKVLVGLAAVAVVLYLLSPSAVLSGLPLLILLVCPLAIVLMMWGMGTNPAPIPEGTPSARPLRPTPSIVEPSP
jgi:hypothetical protein